MQTTGKRHDEATVMEIMGKAYADINHYKEAIDCFASAYVIYLELGIKEHAEQVSEHIEILKQWASNV